MLQSARRCFVCSVLCDSLLLFCDPFESMYCYTFLQVLGEMQRRGVSRDALVSCLREMGREMPLASVRMLQARICLCRCLT